MIGGVHFLFQEYACIQPSHWCCWSSNDRTHDSCTNMIGNKFSELEPDTVVSEQFITKYHALSRYMIPQVPARHFATNCWHITCLPLENLDHHDGQNILESNQIQSGSLHVMSFMSTAKSFQWRLQSKPWCIMVSLVRLTDCSHPFTRQKSGGPNFWFICMHIYIYVSIYSMMRPIPHTHQQIHHSCHSMQRHSMSSWGIVIWANWISPSVLRSSQSQGTWHCYPKSKIKFPTFLVTTNNQVAHKTAFLIFHFHGCHMLCRAVAHIHEAHGIIATLSERTNSIDQPLPVLEEMRRRRSIFVSGDSLLLQVELSWI